jgi:hypothetical protein
MKDCCMTLHSNLTKTIFFKLFPHVFNFPHILDNWITDGREVAYNRLSRHYIINAVL